MVDPQATVLIVDEDEIHREMLENMLEDDVRVITAATAQECLDALEQKPDLIVIDPPGGSPGWTLIPDIRNALEENSASLIVLTEESGFDTRLQAYEAGANDFLAKPFQPEEFLAKVQLNLNAKQFYRKLKQDAMDAMQTAMAAMKQSSDLGLILRFMEDTIRTQSHEELARVLREYLQQFSINCAVMIVSQNDAKYYYCGEDSQSSVLMAMCREKGRFVDIGLVTVTNGSDVTILVREMPHDEARYGEIKDVLGIMINLADARARSISTMAALHQEQQFGLQAQVQKGIERVIGMQNQIEAHAEHINRGMSGLKAKVSATLLAIGATEEQDATFTEMIEDYLEDMEDAYSGIIGLENDLKALTEALQSISASDG